MAASPAQVLSIGKLGADSPAYYLGKVAAHMDDYYAVRGEAPGRWSGRAADRLGLSGDVDGEQLAALLGGADPRTGQSLLAGVSHPKRVPGLDLAFSAPKGLSVLWALSNPADQARLRAAHRAAVADALAWLEGHAGEHRLGRGGQQRQASGGWVCATFEHRASRAGDPQLHSHVLVANISPPAGHGPWRAVDTARVYRAAKTAGTIYQAVLRARLLDLGLAATVRPTGLSDLPGVPDPLVREFSRRRADIEQALAERGTSSSRAAQAAALATRQRPGATAGEALPAQWAYRATTAGHPPPRVVRAAYDPPAPHAGPKVWSAAEHHLLGPTGLTGQTSTFTRRDVLRGLAVRLPAGADVADLEQAADRLLADREVVALLPDADQQPRWTTADLLACEQDLLRASATARTRLPAPAPERVAAALAAHPHLGDEQRDTVITLLSSRRLVDVVEGAAGAGKSTALSAARHAWAADGRRVLGVALARAAAEQLRRSAQLTASDSLAALLVDLDAGRSTLAGSVVVLDEAGMVGTRDLHRLLEHARRARDCKLVLVGDPHQLPEIDAGGVFGRLAARVDSSRLTTNRRQQQPWEVAALAELRCGDVTAALSSYAAHRRIQVHDAAADVRAAVVRAWAADRAAGRDSLMLAATRSDVAALNVQARDGLRAAGLLGDAELVVDVADLGTRAFAAGATSSACGSPTGAPTGRSATTTRPSSTRSTCTAGASASG